MWRIPQRERELFYKDELHRAHPLEWRQIRCFLAVADTIVYKNGAVWSASRVTLYSPTCPQGDLISNCMPPPRKSRGKARYVVGKDDNIFALFMLCFLILNWILGN